MTLGRASALCPSLWVSRVWVWRTLALGHHPHYSRPRTLIHASHSPWVILADTISVICEVSFCRNSSVPTSARVRWPWASAARGSPGGQTLAEPVCTPDKPKQPLQTHPDSGLREDGYTGSGLCCQKQRS